MTPPLMKPFKVFTDNAALRKEWEIDAFADEDKKAKPPYYPIVASGCPDGARGMKTCKVDGMPHGQRVCYTNGGEACYDLKRTF